MSPHSPPDLSASIAAFSSPIATTTPVDNFTQPTAFADQSQSRLMTLPKELRNKIYEFVFCDNSTYVDQPIKYHQPEGSSSSSITRAEDVEIEIAHVPIPIRLDRTRPPFKDSILPCRQLYAEMAQMQAAAWRAYWTTNHFLYRSAQMSGRHARALPAREEMMRIREFRILLCSFYHLRVVFDGLIWTFWLLREDGRMPSDEQLEPWLLGQNNIQYEAEAYMAPIVSFCHDLSPYTGSGLTQDVIEEISRDEGVTEEISRLDGVLYPSDDEVYSW